VDVSEEGTEPDREIWDTSVEKEILFGDSLPYFENITSARDQNQFLYPDFNKQGSVVDYFISILTEEILEIIRGTDKSLRNTGAWETTGKAGCENDQL
jgi:hypothetical protein